VEVRVLSAALQDEARPNGWASSVSGAVDRDLERRADLGHPVVAETTEPFHEHADRSGAGPLLV
jgi:hypothetical protein